MGVVGHRCVSRRPSMSAARCRRCCQTRASVHKQVGRAHRDERENHNSKSMYSTMPMMRGKLDMVLSDKQRLICHRRDVADGTTPDCASHICAPTGRVVIRDTRCADATACVCECRATWRHTALACSHAVRVQDHEMVPCAVGRTQWLGGPSDALCKLEAWGREGQA